MDANLSNEFKQKYEHTYVRVRLPNVANLVPCYITAVSASNKANDTKFPVVLSWYNPSSKNWGDATEKLYEELDFDLRPPNPGLYNTPSGSIFIYKQAAKQFKKGFCHEYYSLMEMNSARRFEFKQMLWPAWKIEPSFTSKALQASFRECGYYSLAPSYPTLKEAQELLKSNVSVALSIKWGLALSADAGYDYELYRNNYLVGYGKEEGYRLNFHVMELFYQEFYDFMRRKDYQNVSLHQI